MSISDRVVTLEDCYTGMEVIAYHCGFCARIAMDFEDV